MTAAIARQAYPSVLRHAVHRAARLSHTLAGLVDRVHPDDAAFVWVVGRADEVRAVVAATMREWQEGRLHEARAAERIGTYVRGLEETLQAFFGTSPPPLSTSQVRVRRRRDTLIDE